MRLVICEPTDTAALWAYEGLRRHGIARLEIVSTEALVCSLRCEHRVGSEGASIAFEMPDGRRWSGEDLRGVLNRAFTVPLSIWRQAPVADSLYVQQELYAFFLSWLHCLPCPVFNAPSPLGLAGRWRLEAEWVCLAAQAGLNVPVFRQTSLDSLDEARGERRLRPSGVIPRSVIVACGVACGPGAPADVREGCVRLAKLSGTALLGVDFVQGDAAPWTFGGATPAPDLRLGGEAVLAALALGLDGG
jgi:hypothetical protein